ncbi:MAG: carbohydrate kinase family protein [Candidatus Bathyarchaeota archaeon]
MLVSICGIAVTDIVAVNLPKVAEPGELIFTPIQVCIGGHALNVSVDLVQMGIPEKKISVIVSVGEDVFGRFLEENLARTNLKRHILRSESSTSKDLILVVEGEDRRFHVDVGANLSLNPQYVYESLEEDKSLMFYLGGAGMLGKTDDELEGIFRRAKELGCVVFADIVTPYRKKWSFVVPALKWIDVFHCNDHEAKMITGETDLSDATKVLSNLGVKASIVTLGKDGLVARIQKAWMEIPAFNVKTVDPTGAGDAFCAGILHQLIQEPHLTSLKKRKGIDWLTTDQWKEMLINGSAYGAACCMQAGTATSVKPEHAKKLIEEQGAKISQGTKFIELGN